MRHDEVGEIARKDEIIMRLGGVWIKKNLGNELKRGKYTSQVMRLIATLLRNFRSITGMINYSMWDALTPDFYRPLVYAVLTTATHDLYDINELKAPSNALKLGFDVKRMIRIKVAEAVLRKDHY